MACTFISLLLFFSALFAVVRGAPLPASQPQQRDDDAPARVPYVFPPPGTDPIADAIRARRTNGTLLALDGALLNAPLYAQAWNDLFTVVRENNTIPGTMRELIILRTAVVNNAAYEWFEHEPVARMEGLTTEQLRVIRFAPVEGTITANDKAVLGDELAAALEFTDVIGKAVHVPTSVYNNLARFLNTQQIVEAVGTAGSYALVSRFTVALDVDGKMSAPVPVPM
ncbi:4-carboxymuconolactone decarboxylase [Mycena amicta]|nr:4-carboxymuconolactone decarboxylase [Mycena amicta]